MSDFGGQLKQAREQRGISLRQIASATKISIVALEALERNDFSRLPGGIFSRAFVRAYALEVGLDPDRTVEEFLVEYEQNHNAAVEKAVPEVTDDDRAFLERQRRAARWLRGISAGVLIVLAGGAIAWRFSRTHTTAAPVATPAETPAENAADPVEPPAEVTTAPAEAETAPEAEGAAAAVPADQVALRLQITADCWVRATVDGTVVLEQTLAPGDTRELKPGREVYLQVGNAGAVRWWINGQPAKSLGQTGQTAAERINRTTLAGFLAQ
jgi:cytoskeletal protein RodZ